MDATTPMSEDRRVGGDRRRGQRRRYTEGRRLVLHLGRASLRLGVSELNAAGDPDSLQAASIRWNEGAAALPHQAAFDAAAAAVKRLAIEQRLVGGAVTLILGAGLCVSRVVSGPTARVGALLEELDERSQSYLSLGAGAKVIAVSRVSLGARYERAVASVAREETIGSLLGLVEAAGMELSHVEAESLAMARAQGVFCPDDHSPAVIAHCEGGAYDIAVAHQGELLLDYRPGVGARGLTLGEFLRRHQTRLERFCRRELSDDTLTLDRVYLTGDTTEAGAALCELRRDTDLDPALLDPTAAARAWPHRREALGPEDALVLARLIDESGEAAGPPSPNLIERWVAESRRHVRPILLRAAAPIVATLVLAAGLAGLNWRAANRVAELDQAVAALRPARVEHEGLRRQLAASSDKLRRLKRLRDSLPRAALGGVIDCLAGCLPEDVWLDQVHLDGDGVMRLKGYSYGEGGVYDVVRHLDAAPHFASVALERAGQASTRLGPATGFELRLALPASSPSTEGAAP